MKGLSFSQEMMVQWLKGNKSITRRLMNPQPSPANINSDGSKNMPDGWLRWKPRPKGASLVWNPLGQWPDRFEDYASYLPGETVYIKETWCQPVMRDWKSKTESCHKYNAIEYAADMGIERFPIGGNFTPRREQFRWRSPRYMPEWAARSHALIISVRPEKLNSMSDSEVIKEGVDNIKAFMLLWDKIHKGGLVWEKNPWVWVVTLERCQ